MPDYRIIVTEIRSVIDPEFSGATEGLPPPTLLQEHKIFEQVVTDINVPALITKINKQPRRRRTTVAVKQTNA